MAGFAQDPELDRFALYERAVQNPAHEVKLFTRAFKSTRGRPPVTLREDFSGTGAVSAAWVASDPARVAWAVDHDPAPLDWGRVRYLPSASDDTRARLHFVAGDVRTTETPAADVVAAENFSYCVFHTRAELRTYFECAHGHLTPEGAIFVDVQGGPATQREGTVERRDVDDFLLEWEHRRFDPATYRTTYAMHFERADARLDDAFVYDWRHWTLPELRELLAEAGFAEVQLWWPHAAGARQGQYRRRESPPAHELWVAYLVAFR